jgi:hypothetical protein
VTFATLRRHAVFPILLYLPLSQILRDEYPVSHFPMYSNPTTKPLKIHTVTDGSGQMIALVPRSGVTASHVSKKFGYHVKQLIEQEEKSARKEGRPEKPEEAFAADAAVSTLSFLRGQSLKRKPKVHLIGELHLWEARVTVGAGGFEEENIRLGTLPATTAP